MTTYLVSVESSDPKHPVGVWFFFLDAANDDQAWQMARQLTVEHGDEVVSIQPRKPQAKWPEPVYDTPRRPKVADCD